MPSVNLVNGVKAGMSKVVYEDFIKSSAGSILKEL